MDYIKLPVSLDDWCLQQRFECHVSSSLGSWIEKPWISRIFKTVKKKVNTKNMKNVLFQLRIFVKDTNHNMKQQHLNTISYNLEYLSWGQILFCKLTVRTLQILFCKLTVTTLQILFGKVTVTFTFSHQILISSSSNGSLCQIWRHFLKAVQRYHIHKNKIENLKTCPWRETHRRHRDSTWHDRYVV